MVFPVPAAVFSLPAFEVSASPSTGPVLVSPLPAARHVAASARQGAAWGGEERAHSGWARDDNPVVPRVDDQFAPGAEPWGEVHLAE